jgi:hypothetical protein
VFSHATSGPLEPGNTAANKEKIYTYTYPDYWPHRGGHSLFRKPLLLLLPRSRKGCRHYERSNALLLGLVHHLYRASWFAVCPVYSRCCNGTAAGGWHRVFLYRGLVGAPGIPFPTGCGLPGLQAKQNVASGEESEPREVCQIARLQQPP